MHEAYQQDLLARFEPIFYPKSLAVVGASQNTSKSGSVWVKTIIDAGFGGKVYPVGPHGGEIQGLEIYPSLRAIPGPVDYVIASIPRESVPSLLDDCTLKRVKAIQFFTAGFSELGDELGYKLERELVEKARQGGFRVIGPNCIGTYCPESRIPYGPRGSIGKAGSVGFVCQSGGIGGRLIEMGEARGINFSKGISFGNGIDLDGTDFLEYMAVDAKTSVIGAYLEGTRDGRRLFQTIRQTAKFKPMIIWKGGRTGIGAQVAMSHTGSLASSAVIWSAALKQTGAIEVHSMEELIDTMLIFQQLHRWQGNGVAIMGGLAGGGGGISVSASDICTDAGLDIPPVSAETRQKLTSLLGEVGTILRNPIDVSQSGSNPVTLKRILEAILADSSIDLVVIQEDIEVLLRNQHSRILEAINTIFIDLRVEQSKPIVIVLPPSACEPERLRTDQKLSQASIPVFPTMERASRAIMHLKRYCHIQVHADTF